MSGRTTPASVLERAEAERRAGRLDEAAALAERGLSQPCSAVERARLHLVVATVERQEGKWPLALERLRTEAALVAGRSPGTAVALLCEASRAAFHGADTVAALATAEDACLLAGRVRADLRAEAEITLGLARLIADDTNADSLLEEIVDRAASSPPTMLGMIHGSAAALLWVERYDDARALLERVIERARHLKSLEFLPLALDTLGGLEFRIGRWRAAEGHSSEALRLGRETGSAFDLASCHTTLARLEAARGRRTESERHLEAAQELCGENSLIFGYIRTAAALLELSLGRPDHAAEHLLLLAESDAANFDPAVLHWEADLVEALVRVGRSDEAAAALERFERRARSTTRASIHAALHRCHGLLAPTASFDEEFVEGLRWHSRSQMPFEQARTELCYAERLRRVRRPREAQAHFRSALGTFGRLGAAPWLLRARRGLAGRGERRRAMSRPPLTPHESQVASLVQRGATNKEAAAVLFVTPKTIEYHLANIYRKLGVRSRTELVWLLTQTRA